MWRIEWYDGQDDQLMGEYALPDSMIHELVDVLGMTVEEAAEGAMIPLARSVSDDVLAHHGVEIPENAEAFLTFLAD